MIRIVAGEARGRRLAVPAGNGTRPTTDRVRESLFNILNHRLAAGFPDLKVLDLFAGSGAFGLEARSRGASRAVFVEADRQVAPILKANLAVVPGDNVMVASPVERYLSGPVETFDLVFLDPPYAAGLVNPTLSLLVAKRWLRPGSLVVAEHEGTPPLVAPMGLALDDERRYGRTVLSFLVADGPKAAD